MDKVGQTILFIAPGNGRGDQVILGPTERAVVVLWDLLVETSSRLGQDRRMKECTPTAERDSDRGEVNMDREANNAGALPQAFQRTSARRQSADQCGHAHGPNSTAWTTASCHSVLANQRAASVETRKTTEDSGSVSSEETGYIHME